MNIGDPIYVNYLPTIGYTSPDTQAQQGFILGSTPSTNSLPTPNEQANEINASRGVIAGWNLTVGQLFNKDARIDSRGFIELGANDNIVRMDSQDTTYRIWVGNAVAASAPFSVTKAGVLNATGAVISGTITATTGTIGGWTIGATTITSGNISLDSANEKITLGLATAPLTGTGIFLGKDGSDYEFRAGNPAGSYIHWTGSALTLKNAVVSGLAAGSEAAIQAWTYSGTFSVTDADTIAWSSGTLTLADGSTYSITAGNTGNMAAFTYIFFNIAVSSTAFQVATSFSAGSGKILIATAQNGTSEASYLMLGGAGQHNIDGQNIAAASILASNISVTQLSAISANLGTITAGNITLDTSGYIRGGQTDYNTGVGFFLGYSGAAYKFSVGDPSGSSITWDGSTLAINGVPSYVTATPYGDGSDGNVTISVDTTLTRDMFYDNLTVNSSKSLNTGGYRVYVKGTLTNNGTIHNNGGNGGNGGNATTVGGTAGTAGAVAGSGSFPTGKVGIAGTAGANGVVGPGASGINSSNASNGTAGDANSLIGAGIAGVRGGQGGKKTPETAGQSGTAGTAGTSGGASAHQIHEYNESLYFADCFTDVTNWSRYSLSAGTGGSSGGGSGSSNNDSGYTSGGGGGGGGSGAAGGVCWVAAFKITGTGTISAKGGNGGTGGNGGSPNPGGGLNIAAGGGGGGGSGGNGGVLILTYAALLTGAVQTTSVAGGTYGNGGTAGTGTGAGCDTQPTAGSNGNAGNAGKLIQFYIPT